MDDKCAEHHNILTIFRRYIRPVKITKWLICGFIFSNRRVNPDIAVGQVSRCIYRNNLTYVDRYFLPVLKTPLG